MKKVPSVPTSPLNNLFTVNRKVRFHAQCLVGLLVLICLTLIAGAGEPATVEFDKSIAPLFVRHCLECHNRNDRKGELDLSRRAAAMRGGDSGVVIEPGRLADSLVWDRIRSGEMPPDEELSAEDKEAIKQWIDGGAVWGTDPIDPFLLTTEARAGYDWWSLQPLQRTTPPAVTQADWCRNPIDSYVLAKLESVQLAPSPRADRRTLIRRVTFDLLGLPPTPAEVNAFLSDTAPDAYERLIERLLSSPHYGERWARHWLDVARFGESDGFEYDRLRPNAWRYRDWVVRALNEDMPYDRFVRWQIAGDVIAPEDADGVIATGFLVCGAHDSLIPQGDIQKAIMRQDELEDLVGTVAQTFLGLTVNCARCHDHKFDPIHQREYYQLSAALAGVKRGDRGLATSAATAALDARMAELHEQISRLDRPARKRILARRQATGEKPALPTPLARWRFDNDFREEAGQLHGSGRGNARLENGGLFLDGKDAYVATSPISADIGEKTLVAQVSLANLDQRGGAAMSLQTLNGEVFDAIVFGEREPRRWMAGSDGFSRTQSFQGDEEAAGDLEPVHMAITYQADGTITGFRNGQPYGQAYASGGLRRYQAGDAQVLFGLRHGTAAGAGRMLAGVLIDAQLFDRALSPAEVAALAGVESDYVAEAEIQAELTAEQREERQRWNDELAALTQRKKRLESAMAFAVTPNVQPGVTHLLERGNPGQPAEAVAAAGIAALADHDAEFGLTPQSADAARRTQLAEWLAHSQNSLFARTIVNRLWHYHFGRGFIETPNDLGFSGGPPSHPQLVDWLAASMREHDWSIKALHRLIVSSATYQQSSRVNPAAIGVDADNRLLWRMSPRRLEAEVVRDAMLAVSGVFNSHVGGPGFQDFKMRNHKNTMHYDPIDPIGPEFHRRSLYRTWARGGRNPLLDTFDCPDPSATAPRRGVTTTPLQALALLNNSFVLRMADGLAERVCGMDESPAGAPITRIFQLAYNRQPTEEEMAICRDLANEHGLPAVARVVLNSNEFLFVE